MNIKPKCLYANKDLAFTTTGHLTPCCWVNNSFSEPYLKNLLSPEMNIDNFSSLEEILESEPWNELYRILLEEPEKAPHTCKFYCGRPLNEDPEGKAILIRHDN
jgi:hypothetical protein